jgi:hypothetical protein
MIIWASAASDSEFSSSPMGSLSQILRSKKIIAIRTMMNVMLATINCNVNITVSLATTISSANLQSISPQVQHPFHVSILLTTMHLSWAPKMQLMASNGNGVDKAMANILSKEN